MTREGFSLFAAFRCAGRGIIDTAHERNFHIEFACIEIPNRDDAHSEHVLQDCRLTSLSIRDFGKSDI